MGLDRVRQAEGLSTLSQEHEDRIELWVLSRGAFATQGPSTVMCPGLDAALLSEMS